MHKEAPWPADAVERRPVASLVPYARNARTHSDEQVAQIAASIREWGWTVPVLVDEQNTLIAGHGRVLAAQKLGLVDVPVMVARGWSDAQKRAYVLADNRLALNAGWDDKLLGIELKGLKDDGFDIGLAGFTVDEIEGIDAPPFDEEAAWDGMPEFEQPDVTSWHHVVVHFKDAAALAEFAQLLGQQMTQRTKSTWHPPIEDERYMDKRYSGEP
ncbi:MAG: chromosome partitioning protein ParB family [Spirosoma sp.]|nr:chromosome partitioning protein ParB family [Spirosoma sp.]